jgi:hypothetical protein
MFVVLGKDFYSKSGISSYSKWYFVDSEDIGEGWVYISEDFSTIIESMNKFNSQVVSNSWESHNDDGSFAF